MKEKITNLMIYFCLQSKQFQKNQIDDLKILFTQIFQKYQQKLFVELVFIWK